MKGKKTKDKITKGENTNNKGNKRINPREKDQRFPSLTLLAKLRKELKIISVDVRFDTKLL